MINSLMNPRQKAYYLFDVWANELKLENGHARFNLRYALGLYVGDERSESVAYLKGDKEYLRKQVSHATRPAYWDTVFAQLKEIGDQILKENE